MSKVLIVSPYKVLRQALALALFPEHEVVTREGAPEEIGAEDCDLVILDAAAFRERDALAPQLLRPIQSSKIPALWLDDTEGAQAPKRDQLRVLKKPIEKEAFHSAVAALLSLESAAKERGSAVRRERSSRSDPVVAGKDKKGAEASDQGSFQFVDLVDVVDDDAQSGKDKKAPGKPK